MRNMIYGVIVLVLCTFVWGVYEIVTHVSSIGVRGVALEIWCGKEGCK